MTKELNYNLKTSAKNTIKALGYVQDASAKIYSLSNLITPIWTGTVNSIGRVVDINNNSPYLSYGDYRVVIEKCDYDTETNDFRVPDTSIVNLSIGCSSALEAHRLNDVHVQLQPSSGGGYDTGDIKITARTTPPIGWLICDGSLLNRITYATLFSAIGTSYGAGDGVNTFNIPDMRGRVPVGVGASGVTSLGSIGGEQQHILTIAELAAHTHLQAAAQASAGLSGSGVLGNGPSYTGSTGSNMPHNNMQPYLGVNYIIKT